MDLRQGVLVLQRVRALDQKGKLIASLASVQATGLSLIHGPDQIIHVKGTGLVGRLTREKDGHFDIQDLLPESHGPSGKIPFEVTLQRCRLRYDDRSGPKDWSQTIETPRVSVVGVGQEWAARSSVNLLGVGNVDVAVVNQPAVGLHIHGSTKRAEVSTLLSNLRGSAEGRRLERLAAFHCRSLVVQGPFAVRLSPQRAVTFEARIQASIDGPAYDRFDANSIRFDGIVNQSGAAGKLDMKVGETTSKFWGSAIWSQGTHFAGMLDAGPVDGATLPPWARPYLPAGLEFKGGRYHGWLAARSASDYRLAGDLTAISISYKEDRLDHPEVGIDAGPKLVTLKLRHGTFGGQGVSAGLVLNRQAGTIDGVGSTRLTQFGAIAKRIGVDHVDGSANISVTVSGKANDPTVAFDVLGKGQADFDKHHIPVRGFEGIGKYVHGDIQLDRAYVDSPAGLVSARGAFGKAGDLGIAISGRALQLSSWDSRLSGTSNLSATVTGTLKTPKCAGRVEGFDLSYQDQTIPALVSNFKVDRRRLELDHIESAKGTASVTGFASLDLKSKAVAGRFSAKSIQLGDWLGDDVVGTLDAPDIGLTGSLSEPLFSAKAHGSSLIVHGVKIDSASMDLSSDGTKVNLHNLECAGADGTLAANGEIDLGERSGQLKVDAKGLSLDQLMPKLGDSIVVGGKITATADLDFRGSQISHLQSTGQLEGVSFNNTPIGNGPIQLNSDGKAIHGSLAVGYLDRFLELDDFSYIVESKRASGELTVLNVPAENIVSAIVPILPNLSESLRDDLSNLKAKVSLSASIEGTTEAPEVQVHRVTADKITFRAQPLGDLDAAFDLKSHRWSISNCQVSNGPIKLKLKGTLQEQGEIHLDGNTDNQIDLSGFGELDPRLSSLTGTAHLWFSVDGPTRSPRIVASLKANDVFAIPATSQTPANEDKNLRFNFDKIVIDPSLGVSKAIQASGDFFYRGVRGSIDATTPFNYPFEVGTGGSTEVKIVFSESKLNDIAPLIGGIDAKRSSGTLGGELDAVGSSSAIKVNGSVHLTADALAFNGLDDSFRDVKAIVSIHDNQLDVQAGAKSIRGGDLSASLSTPVGDLNRIVEDFGKTGLDSILDRAVTGHAALNNIPFRQQILQGSLVSGTVSSQVDVGGTIRAPLVTGQTRISSGDFIFKGVPSGGSSPDDFAINPRFDLKLSLTDPCRLQSSTANLYLLGDGFVQGSLRFPRVGSSLYVDRGTIRLPASLLRIDQGGTVNVDYQSTRLGTTASAKVDLEGTTSATTSRAGEAEIQRYAITLGMKGDLLDPNGIKLAASSDPPDLTQDQILAVLGQGAFLQDLSSGLNRTQTVGAIAQFVVPSLLDPLTAQVAKGIGLDYLSLEYNMFDQASVTFGKELVSGFSVVGSRQLSEPPPGLVPRYDLRIVYRPRRLPGALRQIRFFFGADQDFPWKLGLDYGIRF
ncbi:MAG: translocation/assembly module TamB domain-containing protein [Fimbriimonas sp.]|nr:translocation/assembly module TamB domain-containing protein [Fimbriimonas sp.]